MQKKKRSNNNFFKSNLRGPVPLNRAECEGGWGSRGRASYHHYYEKTMGPGEGGQGTPHKQIAGLATGCTNHSSQNIQVYV